MIIWAPDFRFIWSPRNFDVVRRGGELSVGWRARANLRATGSATYSAVTYDTPGGAQVLYRPRVTYDASVVWSPGPWTADLRWHRIGRRFPNSAGTNPRPAFSLLDARARAPARRGPRRSAARSATSPTGAPSFSPAIRRPAEASSSLSPWWFHDAQALASPPWPSPPWRWAAPTRTHRSPIRRRSCWR